MRTVINLPRLSNSEESQPAGVLGVVWMISARWAFVTSEHIHWAFEGATESYAELPGHKISNFSINKIRQLLMIITI